MMKWRSESLALHLIYYFVSPCVAAPAIINSVTTAALEANCRNITRSIAGPDPACWHALKMDDWLRQWIIGPQACAQYEPWGNCFMRLTNKGVSGIDCMSTDSTEGCYRPVEGDIVQGPAEIWYGAWSIWCKPSALLRISIAKSSSTDKS